VPVTVDEQTFYIDLLFYHVRLHRYFVFELKVGIPARTCRQAGLLPGGTAVVQS
jgi:predicted nuclease of restriction endonuclease-like (RecB) superfamily